MGNTKSLRLAVGSIFPKGPGKVWFYRYQVDGRRKTVSLRTANRSEALKKAQALVPVVKTSTPEIVAAHVEYAKGCREVERNLCVPDIRDYYSRYPERRYSAGCGGRRCRKTFLRPEAVFFSGENSIPPPFPRVCHSNCRTAK